MKKNKKVCDNCAKPARYRIDQTEKRFKLAKTGRWLHLTGINEQDITYYCAKCFKLITKE